MTQGLHSWVRVDDVMISFTHPGPSPDELWLAFAKDLTTKQVSKYLATSIGSVEVNSVQRKLVAEALKKKSLPVAAVTDEKLVRGLVTAVSWLGVDIKAFSWAELNAAIMHLKVPPESVSRVIDATMKLKTAGRPNRT